uniref:Uncharacterized protein n=1 Tax=Manihot esculenta TaxID=3983 RepID=A0A2C9UW46_MANES
MKLYCYYCKGRKGKGKRKRIKKRKEEQGKSLFFCEIFVWLLQILFFVVFYFLF